MIYPQGPVLLTSTWKHTASIADNKTTSMNDERHWRFLARRHHSRCCIHRCLLGNASNINKCRKRKEFVAGISVGIIPTAMHRPRFWPGEDSHQYSLPVTGILIR